MKIPAPVRIMLGVFIIVILGFPAPVTLALLGAFALWWAVRLTKAKPEVGA